MCECLMNNVIVIGNPIKMIISDEYSMGTSSKLCVIFIELILDSNW